MLRTAVQMLEEGEASPPTLIVSKSPLDRSPGDEHAEVVLLAVDESATTGPLTRNSGHATSRRGASGSTPRRECRVFRNEDAAMSPIVAEGAYVAFSKMEEDPADLDGKMVVAWVEGKPLVRWFQFCGRYAVLRAENPASLPAQIPIDLENRARQPRFRRVLWINTPH